MLSPSPCTNIGWEHRKNRKTAAATRGETTQKIQNLWPLSRLRGNWIAITSHDFRFSFFVVDIFLDEKKKYIWEYTRIESHSSTQHLIVHAHYNRLITPCSDLDETYFIWFYVLPINANLSVNGLSFVNLLSIEFGDSKWSHTHRSPHTLEPKIRV